MPDARPQPLRPDVLIIGGGPAGLTAALYLARYHLATLVIDAGHSRAAAIPLCRNLAGHPEGVHGPDLLARMAAHAAGHGAMLRAGTVTGLDRAEQAFRAGLADGTAVETAAVLVATGARDRRPDMPATSHDDALARGLIRYCPVCDGYEVTDRRVAVLGTGSHAAREALFLRGYTRDVTLIAPDGPHDIAADLRAALAEAGVAVVDGPATAITPQSDDIAVATPGGRLCFDSLYPALGRDVHAALAAGLGATLAPDGCLATDSHQRTSVPGLYAAGDVVRGLDQIAHAMGEAAVAATAIRNDLDSRRPLRR